jgi:chromosome segregation ATPase
MNIMKIILDAHSLKKRIEELEASLRSKDEYIRTLENERASLQDRLTNLVHRYKDIESEMAGMNFRLYQATQANKILTMKLTGTAAQRDGMQRWIEKTREHKHGGDE